MTRGMSLEERALALDQFEPQRPPKAYKYDEMKLLVDQLPLVKTGNPAVRRMITHMTSAAGVEYSISEFSHGKPKGGCLTGHTGPPAVPGKLRQRNPLLPHRLYESEMIE